VTTGGVGFGAGTGEQAASVEGGKASERAWKV